MSDKKLTPAEIRAKLKKLETGTHKGASLPTQAEVRKWDPLETHETEAADENVARITGQHPIVKPDDEQ